MPNADPEDIAANFEHWISSKIRRIRKIPNEIVDVVGDLAVEQIKERIEQDPKLPSNTSDKPGRQETGQMHDNTKWWVTSETTDSKRIAIGWQRADFEDHQPGYAAFQDTGFRHYPDGNWIRGVEALTDISHEVRLYVMREMRRKMRDRNDEE